MVLPDELSVQQAFTFVQNSLDHLTGEQIADCVRALEVNDKKYHEAWAIIDANTDALVRYQAYLQESSTDDESQEGLPMEVDIAACETIEGFLQQIEMLSLLRDSDYSMYKRVIEPLPSECYYSIEVFFIIKAYYRSSLEELEVILRRKKKKLKELSLLMYHVIDAMKDSSRDAYVYSVLSSAANQSHLIVVGAFVATAEEAEFVRWRPWFMPTGSVENDTDQ